jgi:hypothetical protein
MNVTIVSPFRDAGAAGVAAYRERVERLTLPGGRLVVVAVEGDSVDDTRAALLGWQAAAGWVHVVRCDTGRPRYPSVVNAERFEILAQVFNAGLEAVDCRWSDYVLFLPSDIRYEPALLERLIAADKDIIAPFTWQGGVFFYDIWAFSRGGQFFTNFGREEAAAFGDEPIEMDTVGGTLLSKIAVLRAGVRYRSEDVDRGFCALAKARGFGIWADPTTHVVH